MVLLFHAGFGWIGGGYFGVSVFFTLSGFLITNLLLAEAQHSGEVSFRRFYSRRMKRLLPASLVCLTAVAVARLVGEFGYVDGLRGQMWGALGQVYNWVRIEGSSSYSQLFGQAPVLVSPLEHYWSLAIEEQFYVVWPIVLVLVARRCRRRGTDVLRTLVMLTVACAVASPLITSLWSSNVGYWSTPTRLGELLVGASAAAWHQRGGRLPAWSKWLAVLALELVIVLGLVLPVGSGPAYSGWMTPVALVSGVLILALQVPGPCRTLLSLRPVVWVGRVSYGLYLYHWPIFTLMRAHGWKLDSPTGAAVALAITVAVASLSYYLVEQPARQASWSLRRTFAAATAGLIAATAAIAVMPATRGLADPRTEMLARAAIKPAVALESLEPIAPLAGPFYARVPWVANRPARIMVVGDSTALAVGQGLAEWAIDHPRSAQVSLLSRPGVGFILDGEITSFDGSYYQDGSVEVVQTDLPNAVTELRPDVVVLMTTPMDIATRQWSRLEGPIGPNSPAFRQRMVEWYRKVTEDLTAMGVPTVVWVIGPTPFGVSQQSPELLDVERYAVQHDVIREVAAGSDVEVSDLAAWLAQRRRSTNWRPDGLHLSDEGAEQLANEYLGPWLVLTALRK